MKDDFPLSKLLEIRERARDQAESRLAAAVEERNEAQRRLSARIEERAELVAALAASRTERFCSDVKTLQRAGEYERALEVELDAIDAAIADHRREVARCEKAVASARADLSEAEAELAVVEERWKQWRKRRSRKRQRTAEDEMDEVAIRIWSEGDEHG